MFFKLLLPTIALSFIYAMLEIQIEGKNGWAEKLPTKKIKNPFPYLMNWPHLTFYHLWMWLFLFCFFHFPFFWGIPLTLGNEITVIKLFILFYLLEDFFWFAFNKHWGIKRFINTQIPWQKGKILYLPRTYWVAASLIVILEVINKLK